MQGEETSSLTDLNNLAYLAEQMERAENRDIRQQQVEDNGTADDPEVTRPKRRRIRSQHEIHMEHFNRFRHHGWAVE